MSSISSDNRIGIAIIIICAIFGALSTLFCGLRLWSHKLRNTSTDWSDYFLVIALILTYGLLGDTVNTVIQGLGMDEDRVPQEQRKELGKDLIIGIVIWIVCNAAVRISILISYMNLFEVRIFRMLCYATIVVNVTTCVIVAVVTFTICHPFALSWHSFIVNGYCMDRSKFNLWVGIWNLISDVAIVALPLPILWGLYMPMRKKISLSCIFCIGLSVCVLTLVRVVLTSRVPSQHLTEDHASIWVLSLLEPLVGIISACLPFMGPVVKRIFGSDPSTDAGENKQHGSSPFNLVHKTKPSTTRADLQLSDGAEWARLNANTRVSSYAYVSAQSSTSVNTCDSVDCDPATIDGILVREVITVHRSSR